MIDQTVIFLKIAHDVSHYSGNNGMKVRQGISHHFLSTWTTKGRKSHNRQKQTCTLQNIQYDMGDQRTKYILLQDRVGETVERNVFSLGFSTKSTPTQVLRGDLLEALPETEQPQDSTKIALIGVERKSLRLECTLEYLTRLSDEDANLLLAISSLEERYQTFMDRIRLDFGRKLLLGSKVYVSMKGVSKKLSGVVWYKGELPSNNGTMFGVELIVSIPSFSYLLTLHAVNAFS